MKLFIYILWCCFINIEKKVRGVPLVTLQPQFDRPCCVLRKSRTSDKRGERRFFFFFNPIRYYVL